VHNAASTPASIVQETRNTHFVAVLHGNGKKGVIKVMQGIVKGDPQTSD